MLVESKQSKTFAHWREPHQSLFKKESFRLSFGEEMTDFGLIDGEEDLAEDGSVAFLVGFGELAPSAAVFSLFLMTAGSGFFMTPLGTVDPFCLPDATAASLAAGTSFSTAGSTTLVTSSLVSGTDGVNVEVGTATAAGVVRGLHGFSLDLKQVVVIASAIGF